MICSHSLFYPAYYALGEARAEIQALRQYVIRQNREYSLAMNVVIAVVATVILIVCVVAAVGFKLWQKYGEQFELVSQYVLGLGFYNR